MQLHQACEGLSMQIQLWQALLLTKYCMHRSACLQGICYRCSVACLDGIMQLFVQQLLWN
jgi:hypothetical protein